MPALWLVASLAVWVACSHEVIPITKVPPLAVPAATTIPLTVAVGEGSFERSRLNGEGVVLLFAEELRESGIFAGVMHPVPPGASPRWEIELLAADSGVEPDSNFWKSAIASGLPPFAFFIWLQNDYTLELEALLLDRRELVRSYRGRASIRHRYQQYANRAEVEAEGVELLVRSATRLILDALARDLPGLEQLNR